MTKVNDKKEKKSFLAFLKNFNTMSGLLKIKLKTPHLREGNIKVYWPPARARF